MLIKPSRQKIQRAIRLGFLASNNEAKYEATMFSLRVVFTLGVIEIQLFTYSILVANQYGGSSETREDRISAYLSIFRKKSKKFQKIVVIQRPQNKLRYVDLLVLLPTTLEVKN